MKRPKKSDFMEANIESSIPAAILNKDMYIEALENYIENRNTPSSNTVDDHEITDIIKGKVESNYFSHSLVDNEHTEILNLSKYWNHKGRRHFLLDFLRDAINEKIERGKENQREEALRQFRQTKIKDTPLNWHIWKRAFDAGHRFNAQDVNRENDKPR